MVCKKQKIKQWKTVGNRRWQQLTNSNLRLNFLLRVLTCNTWGRDLRKKICVFWRSTSRPGLFWMERVALNARSFHSAKSSSSSSINNIFWILNLFKRILKHSQVLCTNIFQRMQQFNVYSLNKLETFIFFLHNIVK